MVTGNVRNLLRVVDDINAGPVIGVRRLHDPHQVRFVAETKSGSKNLGLSIYLGSLGS